MLNRVWNELPRLFSLITVLLACQVRPGLCVSVRLVEPTWTVSPAPRFSASYPPVKASAMSSILAAACPRPRAGVQSRTAGAFAVGTPGLGAGPPAGP